MPWPVVITEIIKVKLQFFRDESKTPQHPRWISLGHCLTAESP